MSKDNKAPVPSIEQIDFTSEEPTDASAAPDSKGRLRDVWWAASDAVRDAAQSSDDLRNAVGFVRGLGATAWKYAGSHPYTVFYGFVGLVLAVLILTIGLWDTIVIAVFVCVGAMIGQIRDGDNGIVNFFSRLFSRRR